MCKLPVPMVLAHGTQKKKLINFVSLEHGFMVRRMIRSPHVGKIHKFRREDRHRETIDLKTTLADSVTFFRQFEQGGVFASWDNFNEYYPTSDLTTGEEGDHNVGLMARAVCFNNKYCDNVRDVIRRAGVRKWLENADPVAKSIACCLWRGAGNFSSYKVAFSRMAHTKIHYNEEI